MKIVNKIILSAVAAAALVFATACSNDYTVEEYDSGAKKVYNQAEIIQMIIGGSAADSVGPFTVDVTDSSKGIGKVVSGKEKKGAIESKKYDYITIGGTGAIRANSDSLAVELNKNGGTVSFKVKSGATIKIDVASTGNTNTSEFTVTGAGINATTESIEGSTYTTKTYTATADGEVVLTASMGDRGTRFNKIVVE